MCSEHNDCQSHTYIPLIQALQKLPPDALLAPNFERLLLLSTRCQAVPFMHRRRSACGTSSFLLGLCGEQSALVEHAMSIARLVTSAVVLSNPSATFCCWTRLDAVLWRVHCSLQTLQDWMWVCVQKMAAQNAAVTLSTRLHEEARDQARVASPNIQLQTPMAGYHKHRCIAAVESCAVSSMHVI